MTDLLERCQVCGALVDEEDLFCANCGTEAPRRHVPVVAGDSHALTHNFECRGCGASMSYDASAQTLRCPFCGSEKLDEQGEVAVLKPQRVVPFQVNQQQATAELRKWLGSSFWRPSGLARDAVVTKISKVYLPYWVFSTDTHTYWTADSSRTPPGARGNWYPVSGERQGRYQGILIGASSVLTPNETRSICPFDLTPGVPPEDIDLLNVTVEQFRVQRKYARPLARRGLEQMERDACRGAVAGKSRNLKVNVRLENLQSEPVLLPVWLVAYTYKHKIYRFLMNGQSGRATGVAPLSWAKMALAALVVFVVLAAVFGLALVANAEKAASWHGDGKSTFSVSRGSGITTLRSP